jgi:hypothetical protein
MGGNDTLMARRRGAAQRPPTSTCGTNETAETGRRWRFRPHLHLWRACSKAVVAFMPPMIAP